LLKGSSFGIIHGGLRIRAVEEGIQTKRKNSLLYKRVWPCVLKFLKLKLEDIFKFIETLKLYE